MSIRLPALLLLLCAPAVFAAPPDVAIEQRLTPAEMHEAGLDRLSPQELQALNRLLRDKVLAPAGAAVARGAAAPASFIGLDDKPVHSRLRGTLSGWEPGTVFVLENGQQWRVLKGRMKLPKPLQSPEIVVVPGVAGRWFLQVDEDLPKARVYRID